MKNFFMDFDPNEAGYPFEIQDTFLIGEKQITIKFENSQKFNYHLYNYTLACILGLINNSDCVIFDLCETIPLSSILGVVKEADKFAADHLNLKVNLVHASSLDIFKEENYHVFLRHFGNHDLFPFIVYNSNYITDNNEIEGIKDFMVRCRRLGIPTMVSIIR